MKNLHNQANHNNRVALHRDIKHYVEEFNQHEFDHTGIIVEVLEVEEIIIEAINENGLIA